MKFTDAFDAYVFDLDGTLTDSAPDILHLIGIVLKEFGYSVPSLGLHVIGPLLENIFHSLIPDADTEVVNRLVRSFRRRYRVSEYPKTRVYAGILPLIEKLHAQGKHLFVATNKPQEMTHRVLDFKGLRPFFDDITCFDSKPGVTLSKGEMLEMLFIRHNLNPQRCVMIGDTPLDMQGGKSAGAKVLAVLYGYGKREALLEEKPDWIVRDESWQAVESIDGSQTLPI